MARMKLTYLLDEWTRLFELSERGAVKPYFRAMRAGDILTELALQPMPAFYPRLCLRREGGGNIDGKVVKLYSYIVDQCLDQGWFFR